MAIAAEEEQEDDVAALTAAGLNVGEGENAEKAEGGNCLLF